MTDTLPNLDAPVYIPDLNTYVFVHVEPLGSLHVRPQSVLSGFQIVSNFNLITPTSPRKNMLAVTLLGEL